MTTLSIPVTDELHDFVKSEAKRRCTNKADIVRYAIKRLAEEEVVNRILVTANEPRLEGSLDELAKQLDD